MRSLCWGTALLAGLAVLPGCQANVTVAKKGGTDTTAATTSAKPVTQPGAGGPSSTSGSVPVAQLFVLPAATKEGEKLTVEEIRAFLAEPANHNPLVPQAPLGLGDVARFIPADNPLTRAKIELGRQLYFDKRLSRDSSVSCATCHDPAKGWAEHTPTSTGIKGQKGGRSAPTIINRLLSKKQFWDGRAESLEEQALGPIQNPIEMGFTLPELVDRLNKIEGYRLQFEKIFGGVTDKAIGQAIASFERTVLVGGSAFDIQEDLNRFAKIPAADLADDKELAARYEELKKLSAALPMSASAKRGKELFFGKAQCSLCHVGANLTDEEYYNIGVGMEAADPDKGRVAINKNAKDTGAFKTPTLRNVAQNGPYMHDGSQKTLADVVDYYDRGGHANPFLHERIKKLNLTVDDRKDLVEFLQSLTGPLPPISAPRLP